MANSLSKLFNSIVGGGHQNQNNPPLNLYNQHFSNSNLKDPLFNTIGLLNDFEFLKGAFESLSSPPVDPLKEARDVVDEQGAGGVNWADVHLRQRLSAAVADEINGIRRECGLTTLQVAQARIEARREKPAPVEYVAPASMWDAVKLACGGS